MRHYRLYAALFVFAALRAGAQVTGAAPPPPPPPPLRAVGTNAPDFTLSGATRYGLLAKPVRLSAYRGQTVVLAFFFQARTKG
jgi:hypothetical protein